MTKSKTTYVKTLTTICNLYEQAIGPGLEIRRKQTISKFWEISRQINVLEAAGVGGYGAGLVARLSEDLTEKYGKGFKARTVRYIRDFSRVYAQLGGRGQNGTRVPFSIFKLSKLLMFFRK